MREFTKLSYFISLSSMLLTACVVGSSPTLAQAIQSGGGGSGGSETPAGPGAAGAGQPLGNGSAQSLGGATAKRPADGPLPFFAAYSAPVDEGKFSVDSKGVTLQTPDNAVKFRIGGRLQLDFNAASLKPGSLGPALLDNFTIRRSYFETYLTLYDAIEVAFQYDFSNDAQPIQDAVLAYRGLSHFVMSVGNFKEPVGQDQLRSDNTTTFVERSLTNAFYPARNFGGLIGTYGDKWTASAGVFGNNANLGIEDNGVAGAARFTYAPILTKDQVLHLGVGGSYRSLDPAQTAFSIASKPEDNEFSRSLVTTGTLRNAQDVGRVDFEAIYQFQSYRITGEYAFAEVGGVTPTAVVANRSDRFFPIRLCRGRLGGQRQRPPLPPRADIRERVRGAHGRRDRRLAAHLARRLRRLRSGGALQLDRPSRQADHRGQRGRRHGGHQLVPGPQHPRDGRLRPRRRRPAGHVPEGDQGQQRRLHRPYPVRLVIYNGRL